MKEMARKSEFVRLMIDALSGCSIARLVPHESQNSHSSSNSENKILVDINFMLTNIPDNNFYSMWLCLLLSTRFVKFVEFITARGRGTFLLRNIKIICLLFC